MNFSSAVFSITSLLSSIWTCKNSFRSEVYIHNGALEQTPFNMESLQKTKIYRGEKLQGKKKSENEFTLTVDINASGYLHN